MIFPPGKEDLKKRDRAIFNSQTKPDVFHASFASRIMIEKVREWMARWITSLPGSREGLYCLDIGSGGGGNSEWLGNYGSYVIGIDHSRARITSTSDRISDRDRFQFLVGDGETPPLKENRFDIVFCSAILHHLPNYGSALESYKHCLNNTGMILITEPCAFNPFAVIRRKYFPSETHTPDEKPFRPRNLINEISRKYDEVYFKRFYLFSVNSPLVEKIFGRRAAIIYFKIFSRIDDFLLRLPVIKELCWLVCLVGFKSPASERGENLPSEIKENQK